jgi:hypothetical protein
VNRYADVEHLVPRHLRITKLYDNAPFEPVQPVSKSSPPAEYCRTPIDVESLFRIQSDVSFERSDIALWAGSYGDFEYAHARMMSRYLQAALIQTMKHTVDQPSGVIQIHPALKLMTGDKSLTPKKAYDLIKQILAPLEPELAGVLKDAYDKAVSNRGKPKLHHFPRKRTF